MSPRSSQDTIIGLWEELMRLWKHSMSAQMKTMKIHPLHLFAVHIIQQRPGVTMKEFAQALKITSPSATALVNRLVKLKWVSRKADPKNRKLVRLHINVAGVRTLNTHRKRHQDNMREMLSFLNEKDLQDFARILINLRDALKRERIS